MPKKTIKKKHTVTLVYHGSPSTSFDWLLTTIAEAFEGKRVSVGYCIMTSIRDITFQFEDPKRGDKAIKLIRLSIAAREEQ